MSEQTSVGVARRLIGHLRMCGVTDSVLSPGSRSGPLALALHAADQQDLIRLHVRIDEREAAFLALGLAQVTGRIVPVVTTSGTAVANLHPAMLEATHAGVPLLAITADRPARLRGTGANQTTEQREIFPGVPFVERVNHVGRVDGPQHLNLEFDEPLIEPLTWSFPDLGAMKSVHEPVVATNLDAASRTVVIAGDDAGPQARRAAEAGGWPLIAEPTSGARTGDHALMAGRLLLGHAPLADRIERVLSFGHSTLSRPVTRLLSRDDVPIVHVGDASTFPAVAGSNVAFVGAVEVAGDPVPDWLSEWRQADQAAREVIDDELDGTTPWDVARTVHAAVPPGGLLVVGSSSPIRDLDLVAAPTPVGEKRRVIGNRGLAGIDGVLSTAIGAALGRKSSRAIAVVGDLTFLHGSNGLLIGPQEPRPDLTIVVVNDDGGSIFSTLEQGSPDYADAFERVYATPTGASLAALCQGYGVPHRSVFPAELAGALAEPVHGIAVLEVAVSRADRRGATQRLSAAVAEQISR